MHLHRVHRMDTAVFPTIPRAEQNEDGKEAWRLDERGVMQNLPG